MRALTGPKSYLYSTQSLSVVALGKSGPLLAAVALVVLMLSNGASADGIPVVSSGPWLAWFSQTVDSSLVDGYPSIAMDSNGRVHVAYKGDLGVYYAVRDGLLWSVSSAFAGHLPSIDVDSDNLPHISYWRNTSDLAYARFDGTSWSIEIVDTPGDMGRASHLRLDSQDRPHISYRDRTNEDLKYAYKDAGGWHVEVVDANADAAFNSLALDSSGVPHISYASSALKYASRTGAGSWTFATVDSSVTGQDNSLSIDTMDRPHISYMGPAETLRYAMFDGSIWVRDDVDGGSPTGWFTSIDTDSMNRPHISYHQVMDRGFPDNPLRDHLRYATKTASGSWSVEFADAFGDTEKSSIVVGPDDRPRIAYWFVGTQPNIGSAMGADLKFAEPVSATLLGLLG